MVVVVGGFRDSSEKEHNVRRCIEAHEVPGFGVIPVGSLWVDGSPCLLEEHADKFETVGAGAPRARKPKGDD